MRHFILPALVMLIFSSCSTYQYMILDSTQLSKNEKRQLAFENDTLRLTYDFNGYGGPMSINIYNKTTQPLYVNWKKSALIRDEHSISLYDRNVNFSGMANTSTARFGYFAKSATSGYFANSTTSFNGSFALPEGMDFIAPGSSISKSLVLLGLSGPMPLLIPDSIPKETATDQQGIATAKYQHVHFDEALSPVKAKSYLTFTLGSNNAVEFAESNSFYVSEVFRTHTEPTIFGLYNTQEGDKFFVKYRPN